MIKFFFTNSAGILTSRVFGLFRDLLMAASLGASVYSDIFFVAFKLPNLFRRLFAEGAFTQAFLPNLIKVNKKGIFVAEILIKFTTLMLCISALVMIFAPFITKILAYGFSDEVIFLATPLVRINFWYLLCMFVVTLLASILQYKNHFAITAFSTVFLNLSMIMALILSRNLPQSLIVYYLSWGVVVGGILQIIVHILALKVFRLSKLISMGFIKFICGKRSDNKGFWGNFFQGVIGNSATQLSDFISTFMASFLATGSISYLYYANRVFQLPLALFAIALSTAIFPQISKQIKAQNIPQAKKLLSNGFYILYFLLLFSTITGIILAEEIIYVLFQRGQFNSQNSIQAAMVLKMYMIGLIPFGLYKLFSLWLYAQMKQKLAAKISIYSLILNTVLSLALCQKYGAIGLALAGSLCGFFLFFYVIAIFGFKEFLCIILNKKMVLITILAGFFAVALNFIHNYLILFISGM